MEVHFLWGSSGGTEGVLGNVMESKMPSAFVDALGTSEVLITLAGQGCSGRVL